MAASRQDDRSAEARRIIDRVGREAGAGVVGRTAGRLRDHFAATDADASDPAELWGTRVGRVIGIVAVFALLAWAVAQYAGA